MWSRRKKETISNWVTRLTRLPPKIVLSRGYM
jgi:hypothetical protein